MTLLNTTRIWFSPRAEDGSATLTILVGGETYQFDVSARKLITLAREAMVTEEEIRDYQRTRVRLVSLPKNPDSDKSR